MPPLRSVCAFCKSDAVARPGSEAPVEPELQLLILANNPWWRPEQRLCAACVEAFRESLQEMRRLLPALAKGELPILPTAVRLRASDPFRGRGVTSLARLLGREVAVDEVMDRIARHACAVLGRAC